jgi:hypothetical protein
MVSDGTKIQVRRSDQPGKGWLQGLKYGATVWAKLGLASRK